MYFFTHLKIAKVLYRHFAGEVELDRHAFSYGNIKPDLPSPTRIHHTLDNCLSTVCEKADQLLSEDVTREDFSLTLGEICHYVCDFFCYYHLNEKLHNQSLRHFTYELMLHLKLLKDGYQLTPDRSQPRRDIEAIVLDMRKAYFEMPRGMQRDLDYAFTAALWVCDSIIYFIKYSMEIEDEAELALYSFLLKEGGSL